MRPFKKMYYHLFNAITDALKAMKERDYESAEQILITAQQWSENAYIEKQKKKEIT